jgi:hypothetical protein
MKVNYKQLLSPNKYIYNKLQNANHLANLPNNQMSLQEEIQENQYFKGISNGKQNFIW